MRQREGLTPTANPPAAEERALTEPIRKQIGSPDRRKHSRERQLRRGKTTRLASLSWNPSPAPSLCPRPCAERGGEAAGPPDLPVERTGRRPCGIPSSASSPRPRPCAEPHVAGRGVEAAGPPDPLMERAGRRPRGIPSSAPVGAISPPSSLHGATRRWAWSRGGWALGSAGGEGEEEARGLQRGASGAAGAAADRGKAGLVRARRAGADRAGVGRWGMEGRGQMLSCWIIYLG